MDFALGILLILIMVIAVQVIKIAQEDERFAVFIMGRFAEFRGPGLIFAPPHVAKVVRLKIGDVGMIAGDGFARFVDNVIPITSTERLRTGDAVRIERFNDDGSPQLARSKDRPKHSCPKCGHTF